MPRIVGKQQQFSVLFFIQNATDYSLICENFIRLLLGFFKFRKTRLPNCQPFGTFSRKRSRSRYVLSVIREMSTVVSLTNTEKGKRQILNLTS